MMFEAQMLLDGCLGGDNWNRMACFGQIIADTV